jgi:peptidoglycan/LPS O-acetylase OafA/YrhL
VPVLSILLYHVSFASEANLKPTIGPLLSRLHVGVAIFFVISGFLLYRPFVAARRGHGPPIGIGGYLRRRLLRIVPAYWAALTLLAIWPGLPGVFTGEWWKYYGFLQVYSNTTYLQGIGPTWSLATEMAFYLVLPLFALVASRVTRGARMGVWLRRELALLAVLYLGAVGFRAWTLRNGAPLGLPAGSLPGTFDWFAIGMTLAVTSVALDEAGTEPRSALIRGNRSLLAWGAAAGLFALLVWGIGLPTVSPFAPTFRVTQAQHFEEHLLMGLVALLVVMPAVFGDLTGGAVRALLRSRPAAYLGLISYGIFLWHGPIVQELAARGVLDWIPGIATLVLALVTLAVVVPIATLSYRLVEQPFLRLKHGRTRRGPPSQRPLRPEKSKRARLPRVANTERSAEASRGDGT